MVLKHCCAAMIAATLILCAGTVRALDVAYGAIAIGQTAYGESVAYGFAWNYITKDDAAEAALNACRAGGGADCVERAWFQNGCGALAVDQYGNGGAKAAMTQDRAEARAVQTCETRGGSGCAVVGSQCASPGGEAGTWSGSERVLVAPESDTDDRRAEMQAEVVKARDESLTREQRVQVQQGLSALGFDPGLADGLFGPKTRAAIWDWQTAKGLEATGYLTQEEVEALGVISQETEALFGKQGSESESVGEQAHEESESDPSDSKNQLLHFPQCNNSGNEPGGGCWLAASNRNDCDFFHEAGYYIYKNKKGPIKWSGDCWNNAANGKGTLTVSYRMGEDDTYDIYSSMSASGEFIEGKMQGGWVMSYTYEGPRDVILPPMITRREHTYVDGKLQIPYFFYIRHNEGDPLMRYRCDEEECVFAPP